MISRLNDMRVWQQTILLCRFRFSVVALLLCGAIAGCADDNDPEVILEEYVSRVQDVSGVDVLGTQTYRAGLLVYPNRRDRRLVLADIRIGFLDFLDLDECGLQEIVGQRNSSLGKVMPVSRQLVYEHDLLVGARRCRRQLGSMGAAFAPLRAKLDSVLNIKSADLSRAYWNATFGSPEFERMFSLAASPIPASEPVEPTAEIELALRHLADLGERLGDERLDLESSRLERHYQVLNARSMAGETLHALDLLRFYFDAAARALETRLARSPMCLDGQPTFEARALDEVFRKYFVRNIQPYAAKVHRQTEVWLTEINRMARMQVGQMTPAFAVYFDAQISMDAQGALWSRYQRALARHGEAWRGVMSQCLVTK